MEGGKSKKRRYSREGKGVTKEGEKREDRKFEV